MSTYDYGFAPHQDGKVMKFNPPAESVAKEDDYAKMQRSIKSDREAYIKMIDEKYSGTNFEEIADTLESEGYDAGARYYHNLASAKRDIEESGEGAREFLTDYQKLAATGMPQSKILQTLFQKHHGDISRESLVGKLQELGYSEDYAESAIPEDFDNQLRKAREDGVDEVNQMYAQSNYRDENGNPLQLSAEERNHIIE